MADADDEREVCPGAGQPAERAVERHPFGGVCSVCGQNVHTYDGDWVTGAGALAVDHPPGPPTPVF
jgi:hypothetical protein